MPRTFGVEEELLLVNAESGVPRAVARRVLEHVDRSAESDGPGGSVGAELQSQQIETDTEPATDHDELLQRVRAWRGEAITAARAAGSKVVAAGTSPLRVDPRLAPDDRYRWLVEQFGLTASGHLTCGCHVHVSIESREEGVAVMDRIRILTPILTAISANSPFWNGEDTAYASFRSQVMGRWPTAGPQDVYGSVEAYDAHIDAMLATGVIADRGMIYFDARLSHRYPTLEIRAADVCLDARDTVLIAALCRALVESASQEWREGLDAPAVSSALVRLATWQAGRFGLSGDLIEPDSMRPMLARDVVDRLVVRLTPALAETGDLEFVRERVAAIFERGTGADVQRAVLEKTGQLSDVVAHLARVTAGQEE